MSKKIDADRLKFECKQLFKQYREENPDWDKYLTDSTYYELMDWYDYKMGLLNEDHCSDEAHDFANYVWYTYITPPKFKVGDSIVTKNYQDKPQKITEIRNARYYSGDKEICFIEDQDRWEIAINNKKDFRERYKHIAESDWFKKAYADKSVGEVIPIDDEDPGSDELEEEISRYYNSMTPEQYLNTQNDVIARHFANWQKQQMIKDAIDAKICFRFHRLSIVLKDNNIEGFDCGDKVKLIIIKDNEQRIY